MAGRKSLTASSFGLWTLSSTVDCNESLSGRHCMLKKSTVNSAGRHRRLSVDTFAAAIRLACRVCRPEIYRSTDKHIGLTTSESCQRTLCVQLRRPGGLRMSVIAQRRLNFDTAADNSTKKSSKFGTLLLWVWPPAPQREAAQVDQPVLGVSVYRGIEPLPQTGASPLLDQLGSYSSAERARQHRWHMAPVAYARAAGRM